MDAMRRMIPIGTALLAIVLYIGAGVACAEPGKTQTEEPGLWETFKRKVMKALNWEENAERAGKQMEKTKRDLIEKNRDGGYKKSIKNIEKSIERSSENAQKVIKKNAERLEDGVERLIGNAKSKD